ncbi:MAG: hypothetical protein AB1510_11580 [Bacillota bacterium]
MSRVKASEGLPLARLCMVLASLSPLFLLWTVRGIPSVPDRVLIPVCIGFVVLPYLVLFGRLVLARKACDVQIKTVGTAEDHRDHLLVYLFAVLLPLWDAGLDDARKLSAAIVALAFIIFLFWHLNLHYMNLAFAMLGYRVFSVHPPDRENAISGEEVFVLITKRLSLPAEFELSAYRISNHVFWERRPDQ